MSFKLMPELVRGAVHTLQKERKDRDAIDAALRTFVEQAHGASAAAGWHTDLSTGAPKPMNRGEKRMLIVSELAEAMEGHRRDRMDDKLPHRKMLEVELADAVIRIGDYPGALDNPELRGAYSTGDIPLLPPGQDGRSAVAQCVISFGFARTSVSSVGFKGNAAEHLYFAVDSLSTYEHLGEAVSMAACLHAIFDLAEGLGLDVAGAAAEKMEFNAQRADHKLENRQAAGGKQF